MKFSKINKKLIDLYMDSTSEGVFVINSQKEITFVNNRYLEISGLTNKEAIGSVPTSVLNGWHDPGFYIRMWETIESNGFWEDEVWDSNKQKKLYVLNQKIIHFKEGSKNLYLGIVSDITTKLKTLQELQYLEEIDQSTNISNRFFGEKKLKEFLKEKITKVAVILLDVNNFSLIPETFGHVQADLILRDIADRLKSSLNNENIFTFVQDRFVLYFSYSDLEEIETKAFELIDIFHEPFNIKGNDFFLSVNLGISLFRDDGLTPEELIKNADSAMQESRKEEFNTFSFYEPTMNESVVEQFQILSDLRKSIERKELKMVYQPQVDSGLSRTVGAEALIRWDNKERGSVAPSKFIPLAEKKGIITPIGEWVLRNSYTQYKIWEENNIKDTTMSINISGAQFHDKRLLPLIKNIFYNKVDTTMIEFEITESAFVDDIDVALKIMHSLKDMGFKLAIDDFGTGFSSLGYLKKFPIDKLKIDKSFVDHILTDPGDVAIVKTIVTLARYLDLKVIAEGVETIEQKNLIQNLGCSLIQGFYYSKPLDSSDFINFYNQTNIK
ncbi:MAG: EAL domain-containing protein [Spirochaetales bacterium]|nr:EAL domain-containing protein [Spirochaetales bacterium]